MAASKRIGYDGSSIGGALVKQAMVNMANAVNLLNQAIQLANEVTGDAGVTVANLEGSREFGVQPAQGSAFYSAVNTLSVRVNQAATQLLIADLYQG
jgi:O-acetylhomoserine/O-acetylserine sulfhydrylase-like pyridoxal-dependent enzyme